MASTEWIPPHADDADDPHSPNARSDAEHGSDAAVMRGTGENLHDVEQSLAASSPNAFPSPHTTVLGDRSVPLLISVWEWTLIILVPVITIAYLAFCYVAHYRVVPVNVHGLTTGTTQFLTNLGAGVTTINIIIISIALFPLKGLLSDLQSEEFFRLLSAPKNSEGVKLTAVNGISNPSFTLIESLLVIASRKSSLYYLIAFIAAMAVLAISILAPAALSVQPIIVDGPVMAFSVGTIPPLAFYQPVPGGQTPEPSVFTPPADYSAAIVWAERSIDLSYSFSVLNDSQGSYSGFSVPTPPILNSTVNARWLTDVVGYNPYCTWPNPVNLTEAAVNVTMNSTDVPTDAVSVHLVGTDLQVLVPSAYFPVYNSFFVTSINVHDPASTVFNYTTGNLATDGATVISVIQCASTNCTGEAINIVATFVNFTDIPSMNFTSVGADFEIGFLVCKPNITIETREIRTQGSMTLEVLPLADGASPLPRQGNLDWSQTSLLAAYSLSKLSSGSGPSPSVVQGLGTGTQADFIFGANQVNSIPTTVQFENTSMVLNPLAVDQLAEGYTQMLKASLKPFVSGSLGTSYVPGRVANVQQIFVSSLPHVIVSTVLFFLLFIVAIVAHFRPRKGDKFNLTNIAAALAESEIPEEAKKAKVAVMTEIEQKQNKGATRGLRRWVGSGPNVGQEVARVLEDRKVSLKMSDNEDGLEVLHISPVPGESPPAQ